MKNKFLFGFTKKKLKPRMKGAVIVNHFRFY